MKYNKWTLALAAAGVVTTPSLVLAAPSQVLTALTDTTLSGYVDTSAQWNLGTGNNNNPPYSFGGANKADGFNLDVVDIALDKPMDASQWASGYHVELWAGPDAGALGTIGIRQAYVALRTPIGNGIDWKIGVWDTIIGYEGLTSYNNPNYTRSYGFTIEPTTHTGIQGTYKFSDEVSLTAAVANSFGPQVGGSGTTYASGGHALSPYTPGSANESFKTYMAALNLTAPASWGWAGGSTLSAGVINGYNAAAGSSGTRQTSLYLGSTIATPLTALKFGVALDWNWTHDNANVTAEGSNGRLFNVALYSTYQATPQLSLNLRAERLDSQADFSEISGDPSDREIFDGNTIWEVTATAQYDLWQNVVSRVEFRWDHVEHGKAFGGTTAGYPSLDNAFMLAVNIIYKF